MRQANAFAAASFFRARQSFPECDSAALPRTGVSATTATTIEISARDAKVRGDA